MMSNSRMPEPHSLTGYAERQLDAIDASVFSGDAYDSDEGRARLAWYMGRWCRELKIEPGVQPITMENLE